MYAFHTNKKETQYVCLAESRLFCAETEISS